MVRNPSRLGIGQARPAWLVLALLFGSIGIAATFTGVGTLSIRVGVVCFQGALALVCVRMAMRNLIIDADTVTVRNLRRTWRLRIGDVRGFGGSIPPFANFSTAVPPYVETTTGKRIRVEALVPLYTTRPEEILDGLNQANLTLGRRKRARKVGSEPGSAGRGPGEAHV